MSGNFIYATRHATLNAFINVTMTFKDGDLEKVEIKYHEEIVSMSGDMFFAIMGGDAHDLYEQAAESEQNERLSS
jgi:hypothetical protein